MKKVVTLSVFPTDKDVQKLTVTILEPPDKISEAFSKLDFSRLKTLENLIHNLPLVVFECDLDGNLLFFNRRATELIPQPSVRGNSKELNIRSMLIPAQVPMFEKRLYEAAEGIYPPEEYLLMGSDGKEIPALVYSVVIDTPESGKRVLGVLLDVTREKLAEEIFSKSFRNAPVMMGLTEFETGRYIELNNSYESVTGYSRDELLNSSVFDISFFTNPEVHSTIRNELEVAGRVKGMETDFYTKKGEIKHCIYFGELIQYRGIKHILSTILDISDLYQARKELETEKEKYFKIFNNMQDVLYQTDMEGNLVLASPSALKIFKYESMDDIIGKNLSRDFYFDPSEREVFLSELNKKGRITNYPLIMKDSQGGKIYGETSSSYWYQNGKIAGIEGVFRDNTEKISLERENIAQSLIQIRSNANLEFITGSALKFLELDTNSQIYRYVISSLSNYLQSSLILIGRISGDSFTVEDYGGVFPENFSADISKEYQLDTEMLNKLGNGHLIEIRTDLIKDSQWSESLSSQFPEKGYAIGLIKNGNFFGALFLVPVSEISTTGVDIIETFMYQATIALHRRIVIDELKVARDAAEAANKAKGEFLANVSHELRTPLNGIVGMTELSRKYSFAGELSSYLDIIEDSADSLLRIINDILDFSKIEAGRMEIYSIPFDFMKELGKVIKILENSAVKKGIDIKVKFSGHNNSSVSGDPVRVRQVLVNIIGNSIKFTENGTVLISTDISVSEKSAVLKVSVKDSGIGIEQSKIESIFESFTQVDSSYSRKYGGTGLGLSICKRLMSAMGGDINIESSPGEGTTVNLVFNMDLPAPLSRKTDNSNENEELYNFEGVSVLIAEDNIVNSRYAEILLKRKGLKVYTAFDGNEAVEIFRKNPQIKLILMDIQMPEMDGIRATGIIRNMDVQQPLIIALTAHAVVGDRERFLQAGMDDYISKPVKSSNLLDVLYRNLKTGS
ncbi:MAG: PAS domain S-box protein [Deltaproteobacteria bacterium]|nr:PAS domain S-box protein [Deltaproteobacteria bacterium]